MGLIFTSLGCIPMYFTRILCAFSGISFKVKRPSTSVMGNGRQYRVCFLRQNGSRQDHLYQGGLRRARRIRCHYLPYFRHRKRIPVSYTHLIAELRKLGYAVRSEQDSILLWEGERCPAESAPVIATYEDHRMAMA